MASRLCPVTILAAVTMVLAPSPRAAAAPELHVYVDPRLELLTAAMTQADWPQSRAGYFSDYAREVQQRFYPLRHDPAISTLNALYRRNAPFDAVVRWWLGRAPGAAAEAPEPVLLARAGSAVVLDRLAEELDRLAGEAQFATFVNAHRDLYDRLAAEYKALLPPQDAITRLERFYGEPRAGYDVVLAPLLAQSRLYRIGHTAEGQTITAIVAPDGYSAGTLVFDRSAACDIVYLGFSRPIVAEDLLREPARSRHADWFVYLEPAVARRGIRSWEAGLTETLAHAAAIRLWQDAGSETDANRLRRHALADGLALLPFLQAPLAAYEAARDRYPTYRAFLPKQLAALDHVKPIVAGGGEPEDLGLADVWLTDAGVPVRAVRPASAAAKAGIRAGDTVQSIAGIQIHGSESYLDAWHRWERSRNGEIVPFKVLRAGKTLTLQITMHRAVLFQGFRQTAQP